MSSQDTESNKIVLQSKDLIQLMGLANLDLKINKNSILKINITEALRLVNQHINQIEIRLYGNFVYAISKGILKTLNIISLDLRETIDLMRKNIKTTKKEEPMQRLTKATKKEKINIPTISSTEEGGEELSISTIEHPRHISQKDTITYKYTPQHVRDADLTHDSLLGRENFMGDLGGLGPLGGLDAGPVDMLSEFGRGPLSIEGQLPLEISTPSRIGDFISPRKQKQTFANLDQYLESVKKGEQIIFQEETQPEETKQPERRKKKEASRRKSKKVEFTAELETRWDYDETPNIERAEEIKQKTDVDMFIQKVQAEPVMKKPIEQRLAVNVDHFLDSFTPANLIQFNEKVRHLREEQLALGQMTAEKEKEYLETYGLEFQPEDQVIFPPQRSEYVDQSQILPGDERLPFQEEGSIFQPNRLEEIALSIERERLDENISTTEVLDTIKSLAEEAPNKKTTFQRLTENESKPGKASMFYELLNLAKENKVIVFQRKAFDDIEIEVL